MKISKEDKAAYVAAEAILAASGLEKDKDYAFSARVKHIPQQQDTSKLHVTLPYQKNIVASLVFQGWRVDKKYTNHGNPSLFCSDIHNDESELQELVKHHGKLVEMIRLVR